MIRIILILSVSALFISCFNRQEMKLGVQERDKSTNMDTILINDLQDKTDSNSSGLNLLAASNYSRTKSEMEQLRSALSQKYNSLVDSSDKKALLDSASHIFAHKLLNDIIPYWYGTVWDFNGYTAKPKQGVIACGYFVSTTLRDMGLNLNRYKLAQQGPENEALTIAIDKNNMLVFNEKSFNEKKTHLNDGLYFVGLDNHVGYLYKNAEELFFIHSNYIDGFVMIENIKSSMAFSSSNYFIAPITNNRVLMEMWLGGRKILISR